MTGTTSRYAVHGERRPFSPWLTAALLFSLALACRWWWAIQPRSVRWDEADLLILARNLLRGDGYQIFGVPELNWPPGGPVAAAAALAAGAPVDQALALGHAMTGALAAVLLYGLSRELTGNERAAGLAGLLLALAPALATAPLYWGSMTESLFIALLLAGLWATWRWLRSPGMDAWPAALAAGLAYGASFLVRPEGLGWWAMFLAAALLLALGRRFGPRRLTDERGFQPLPGRSLAAFVLAFLVLAAPYWVYLYHHTGLFLLSGKTGITAVLGPGIAQQGSALGNDLGSQLDSSGQEILWLSHERFTAAAGGIQPLEAARRLVRNLRQVPGVLLGDLVGLGVVGLMGLGLFARPWQRRRLEAELFVLAGLLPMLVVPLFYVQDRLLAPAVPLLLIWAGRGLDVLLRWLEGTLGTWPSGRRLAPLAAALLLAALLATSLWQQRAVWQAGTASQFPSHEAAGQWLAQHTQPGEAIMTRNSEIGLYAGRPLVALPDATWEQVLDYGQARDARYLAIDSWELATVRPQLGFLAQPATAPLPLLAELSDQRRTTWIFELVYPDPPGLPN